MISSEWGEPNSFLKGFNPADVQNGGWDYKDLQYSDVQYIISFFLSVLGKYGRHLHVWDWTERKVIQDIDLGDEGLIPLELRFLHDPNATEGYVAAALSSNVIRFYKNDVRIS